MGILDILKEGRDNGQLIASKVALKDRIKMKSLIMTEEDKEKLALVEKQLETLARLNKYSRPQDIFADYSAEAAKQLVIEVMHGETSGDRRKAAELILSWELGRPLARTANLNMNSATDLSENELNVEIGNLLSVLGFTKETVQTKLLKDGEDYNVLKVLEGEGNESKESGEGTTSEATPGHEGSTGCEEIEKLCAESGLPREFF